MDDQQLEQANFLKQKIKDTAAQLTIWKNCIAVYQSPSLTVIGKGFQHADLGDDFEAIKELRIKTLTANLERLKTEFDNL
jgi:hypothetical protein